MSAIDQAIASFAAQVEANFATLKTDIATLQQELANETLTPASQAALQKLVDDSAALVQQANPTPGTPTP